MPKPHLKVFHINITQECKTAVTAALNMKGHLSTFHAESMVSHTLPTYHTGKNKNGRLENWNSLKPQAIIKSLSALKFQISLIMDFPLILIPITYTIFLKI